MGVVGRFDLWLIEEASVIGIFPALVSGLICRAYGSSHTARIQCPEGTLRRRITAMSYLN
jgi:hypothetical protein